MQLIFPIRSVFSYPFRFFLSVKEREFWVMKVFLIVMAIVFFIGGIASFFDFMVGHSETIMQQQYFLLKGIGALISFYAGVSCLAKYELLKNLEKLSGAKEVDIPPI